MKAFIDLDLGLAIRTWSEIISDANGGYTYRATDYNSRQGVTELAPEYTINTSIEAFVEHFEPRTTSKVKPCHEIYVIIEVERPDDVPYGTPVKLVNKKRKALYDSPEIKEEISSRRKRAKMKKPVTESAIKQEIFSSPDLIEEENKESAQ
ncbi:hypothetical protein MMC22_008611 [Lobaria immixta]|nr:hypothetical protein [Lobaria immixta]